ESAAALACSLRGAHPAWPGVAGGARTSAASGPSLPAAANAGQRGEFAASSGGESALPGGRDLRAWGGRCSGAIDGSAPGRNLEGDVMTAPAAEKWHLRGDWFDACKCAIPCPCTFAQPPTYGDCDGVLLWHVRAGNYGDIALDGLNVVMIGSYA